MKAPVQFLHRCRRLALRLLRLKTRGVKVMVFNPAGELLLVRNSYGRSDLFLLPGGGIERGEAPVDAESGEVREETGVSLGQVIERSTHHSRTEGRNDTIFLFSAVTTDAPLADGIEVTEARFFPLDQLPENVSPATLRRIAEYRGERPVAESW